MLAELVLTQGLFWNLSVPYLSYLSSPAPTAFSLVSSPLTPTWGDVQLQEQVTHRFLNCSRKDLITNSNCKAVSPAQPTRPAEYGVKSSCRHSDTRLERL